MPPQVVFEVKRQPLELAEMSPRTLPDAAGEPQKHAMSLLLAACRQAASRAGDLVT